MIMLRGATIYLPEGDEAAIVAAIHSNAQSAEYEQNDPIIVSNWRQFNGLAKALQIAIEKYSQRDKNLRDDKLNDWVAYRISGCRSAKEFQKST